MSLPLFRLTGIRFAYEADRPVLDGADFVLAPGERVALVGSNGAGKTTLLHLMVGLLKPQAGEVLAFGQVRRAERDFREVRARAGLLFQDPDDQLFLPTVAEDVAFGPANLGLRGAELAVRVDEALSAGGMAEHRDRAAGQRLH